VTYHSENQSIIALTGFMGSGKSSVGRALALLTGWNFVDLDREIEIWHRQKIRDIFQCHGEEHFRQLETEVLRKVLAEARRPLVLALGGGTFVQSGNADLLREHGARVVFLHASPELLLERCLSESSEAEAVRPLASDRESFLRLYEHRLPYYRGAEFVLECDNSAPDVIADRLASWLQLIPSD
jgi:shikimate kinase